MILKTKTSTAGYGLEIPCQYSFYGDTQMSPPWLKSKLECLGYSVVLTKLLFQSQGHMHVSGVSKCNQTWMTTKQTLKYCTVITVKSS